MYLSICEERERHAKYWTVYNSKEDILFFISGRWGRLNDRMFLCAPDGQELYSAKQVLLSLFPRFDLYKRGEKIGSLTKMPSLFGFQPYFSVRKLNWLIKGDFEKRKYLIRKGKRRIAYFERNGDPSYSEYILFVDQEENAPLASLITLLVDHYSENKQGALRDEKEKNIHEIDSLSYSNFDSDIFNERKQRNL